MRRLARSIPTATVPVTLRAGPLDLLFEPDTAFLRQIRWQGREILRAIYGAVRDRNWQTITPQLSAVSLQNQGEVFALSFHALCQKEDVHFEWDGRITGNTSGEIRFEFSGEAKRDFWRNRIGLCVLHPIAGCAGHRAWITHTDGSQDVAYFPRQVSPHQPFLDIRALRQQVTPGVFAETTFEGDVFEMEDQRNWTDTSFKTYSTPLSLPFPVLLKRGERVRQAVTFRLVDERSPKRMARARPAVRSPKHEVTEVKVNFHRLRHKPKVGFGMAMDPAALTDEAKSRLRALQPGHLRVDCRLATGEWRQRLDRARALGNELGAGLQVAIHLAVSPREELQALRDWCLATETKPSLWQVFHEQEKATTPGWITLAREVLGPVAPRALFASGTDFNFAELNRARPPAEADWQPCFSINPHVHSRDDRSVMENLDAQGDAVRTIRAFSKRWAVISPVTLLPRQNPDATGTRSGAGKPPGDPRQTSWFGAAWTLGSLATLTATERVHSLTYFETNGPRGLMTSGREPVLFPAYHVFAAYTELVSLACAEAIAGDGTQRVAALAGMTRAKQRALWLANLSPETTTVKLAGQPRFRATSVIELSESAPAGLASDPESWWERARRRRLAARSRILQLAGHALARVELEVCL